MQLVRYLALVPLVGCIGSSDTSPAVAIGTDPQWGPLTVSLSNRASNDVTAVINGTSIDGELQTIYEGKTGPYVDYAFFELPPGVTDDLDIAIDDGGDTYHEVVPHFAAKRRSVFTSALDHTLHPGETITISDGVDTDTYQASLWLADKGVACGGPNRVLDATTTLEIPSVADAPCGWQAGELHHMELTITITPTAAIAVCDVPFGADCAPVTYVPIVSKRDVDVQF